jgi:hypothetical protein
MGVFHGKGGAVPTCLGRFLLGFVLGGIQDQHFVKAFIHGGRFKLVENVQDGLLGNPGRAHAARISGERNMLRHLKPNGDGGAARGFRERQRSLPMLAAWQSALKENLFG